MARSLGGYRQSGWESAGDSESRGLGLRKIEVSAVVTKTHAVVRARVGVDRAITDGAAAAARTLGACRLQRSWCHKGDIKPGDLDVLRPECHLVMGCRLELAAVGGATVLGAGA
eukprot:3340324-Alexandrium_andersonii.AAC.1